MKVHQEISQLDNNFCFYFQCSIQFLVHSPLAKGFCKKKIGYKVRIIFFSYFFFFNQVLIKTRLILVILKIIIFTQPELEIPFVICSYLNLDFDFFSRGVSIGYDPIGKFSTLMSKLRDNSKINKNSLKIHVK